MTRRGLIALLLLGGFLAGSLALAKPAHRLSWRIVTLPVRGRSFSSAEPGIAVGPGGRTLMIDAASANTGAPPTFWVSRNGGRRWGRGRDLDVTRTSTGDADAAIGPDGYLYALNLGYANPPAQPANPTIEVSRSRDGRTWSGPASFPLPHGLDQPDRPWLVVNPRNPANVDVVNSEGGGDFVIWRSFDHAATFSGPYPVSGGANSQAGLALSSRPLFDPTRAGRMFMLYETTRSSGPSGSSSVYEFPLTQIWLATSTDAGLTWSSRLVLDTAWLPGRFQNGTLGHLLVGSAIDRRGDLYAAFSLRLSGGTKTFIFLTRSTSHGQSWSPPVNVGSPMASNVMPALAVSPRGTAFLSWYGSRAGDFRSAAARWSEMFATSSDPLARNPRFTVSQVTHRRALHIGGIDTAGNVGAQTGANWGLKDFQSIAVGACGQPRLVWAVDNGTRATQTATPIRGCR